MRIYRFSKVVLGEEKCLVYNTKKKSKQKRRKKEKKFKKGNLLFNVF